MLLSLSAMPGGKAEEMGGKQPVQQTAGTALLAAQAPSLLPSSHPGQISWEQELSWPCPGANPQGPTQVSSGAALAAAPLAETALLSSGSVLHPCYFPYSLGYEKPSDGVQVHWVLFFLLLFSILIDNHKLQ